MLTILAILLIGVLGLIYRLWVRKPFIGLMASDSYFHMFIINKIRSADHKIPSTIDEFVLPNRHVYPFFFHYIFSFISGKTLSKLADYLSPVFDFICLLLIVCIYQSIVQESFISKSILSFSFISFAFIFSPALLRTSDGPRSFDFSPRIFGQILFLSTVLFMSLYHYTSEYKWLIAVSICMCFTWVSVIFGIQCLCFFSIPVFFYYPLEMSVLLIASLLLTVLLSSGKSFIVLRGIYEHLKWYRRFQTLIFSSNENKYKKYFHELVYYTKAALTFRIKFNDLMIWLVSERNPVHVVLFFFNIYVIAGISVFNYFFSDTIAYSEFGIVVLVFLTSVVLFLITSLRPMLFLGSSERYLEYGLFSAIILSIPVFTGSTLGNILMAAYIIYCIILLPYFKDHYQGRCQEPFEEQKEFESIIIKLKELIADKTVLPLNQYDKKFINFYIPGCKQFVFPTMLGDDTAKYKDMLFRDGFSGDPNPAFIIENIKKYDVKFIFARIRNWETYLFENSQIFKDVKLDTVLTSKRFLLIRLEY